MKHFKFLLIALLAFATGSKAQSDTLLPLKYDTAHTYLTAAQHCTLIAYMKDKGQAERSRYIFTVLPQIEIVKDSTGKNILKNPDKVIKYAAPVTFLEDMFYNHGSNQERLVAAENRIIQKSLSDQWKERRPDVLQRIGIIVKHNADDNEEVIQVDGIDYMAKLKE